MTMQGSALINSLDSNRFLATKQAKLPHQGRTPTTAAMPPVGKPANHQLTTSTIRAIPGTHTTPPAGSVLQISHMPPPSQETTGSRVSDAV